MQEDGRVAPAMFFRSLSLVPVNLSDVVLLPLPLLLRWTEEKRVRQEKSVRLKRKERREQSGRVKRKEREEKSARLKRKEKDERKALGLAVRTAIGFVPFAIRVCGWDTCACVCAFACACVCLSLSLFFSLTFFDHLSLFSSV